MKRLILLCDGKIGKQQWWACKIFTSSWRAPFVNMCQNFKCVYLNSGISRLQIYLFLKKNYVKNVYPICPLQYFYFQRIKKKIRNIKAFDRSFNDYWIYQLCYQMKAPVLSLRSSLNMLWIYSHPPSPPASPVLPTHTELMTVALKYWEP